MFSSETISTNHSNNFKHVSADSDFMKTSSDLFQNQNNNNQNQQQNGGLARYKSAPSSFLAALLEDSSANDDDNSDESEALLFSSFMNGPRLDLNHQNNDNQMQFCTKQEIIGAESETRPGQSGFSNGQMGFGNGSGLVRQSSSPAGFFNGFGVAGEVGNYTLLHNHVEANTSGSNNLSNHINFSSTPSSSTRFMPTIPENGNETNGTCNPENVQNNGSSWNESSFSGLKRNRDGDLKMFSDFNGSMNQNGDNGKKSTGLVHHLSLPKTSAEMAVVENYLQFQQDTTGVPCQIRAKRGFATHPRSIAERMRRIRISEKMKKLQDLFPNLDKQTNTAEMLDSVVEYIKDLQKQVQTLTDTKAKCVCSSKPQQTSPTT